MEDVQNYEVEVRLHQNLEVENRRKNAQIEQEMEVIRQSSQRIIERIHQQAVEEREKDNHLFNLPKQVREEEKKEEEKAQDAVSADSFSLSGSKEEEKKDKDEEEKDKKESSKKIERILSMSSQRSLQLKQPLNAIEEKGSNEEDDPDSSHQKEMERLEKMISESKNFEQSGSLAEVG